MIQELANTLSRIAPQLLEHGYVIAPIAAVGVLLATRQYLGRWPDLWRERRLLLPLLARFRSHPYVPQKTRLRLRDEEFAGVIDAPPAEVRQAFGDRDDWWPCFLASIQFEDAGDERSYEVGSYALRSRGLLDPVQYHVRLTPRQGGLQTALHAHRELSPWRYPARHYRGEEWDADEGVAMVAAEFANDDRYYPSYRAADLVDEMDLSQFDD